MRDIIELNKTENTHTKMQPYRISRDETAVQGVMTTGQIPLMGPHDLVSLLSATAALDNVVHDLLQAEVV